MYVGSNCSRPQAKGLSVFWWLRNRASVRSFSGNVYSVSQITSFMASCSKSIYPLTFTSFCGSSCLPREFEFSPNMQLPFCVYFPLRELKEQNGSLIRQTNRNKRIMSGVQVCIRISLIKILGVVEYNNLKKIQQEWDVQLPLDITVLSLRIRSQTWIIKFELIHPWCRPHWCH